MSADLKKLTALFKKLGARDPEGWARSQAREGIAQLARFAFLRQAWDGVIEDGDTSWIDDTIAAGRADPDAPGAGAGPALERMLATGATKADICEVARVAQWQTLHYICYLLSDPQVGGLGLDDVNWALLQVDEDGTPTAPIQGLHESVLSMDPSGREMRPKNAPRIE